VTKKELLSLRGLPWLPVRGDKSWHLPAEVHTVFREFLFATQGRFLDIPLKVQQDAADFLHWLGVETNPSVPQVIAHLIAEARQHIPVSREVYIELNRNADDPSIGRLTSEPCLLLADGDYVRPDSVFRQANPFGRFRRLLGPDFDAIGDLLNRLGVKRLPDHSDARDVLIDISTEEDRRFHIPVNDQGDLAVIWRCWRMLDEALANGEVDVAWFAPLSDQRVVPNAAGVLTPPNRLLVDDMPGVAAALDIGDAVIRRKEGLWRAFQAAGVRSLTEAVTIEILHMHETTRDGAVRARMHDRQSALAWVLDQDPDGIQRLAIALGELSFPESFALRVRYQLPDFRLSSAETSLKALYVPAEAQEDRAAQLISCPADGSWPWMLIAKEFARALYPGETPGPLASSLYVALNAPSLDAAHSALDDAGWARLERVDITPPDTTPVAGFAGYEPGAIQPDHGQPDSGGETIADITLGQLDLDAPATGDTHPAGQSIGPAARDTSGARGEQAPGPEWRSQDSSRQAGQPSGTTSDASGSADRVRHRVPHGRLRSYVLPNRSESETACDGEQPGQAPVDTSPVDQAGVRRVVAHEHAEGRHPEVMPHENPGFDIISRDDESQILRHIEVKSISGAWDDMGVGLTRTQFEFAQQHPDTFWLYVVEFAIDDQRARLLRIADPAGRAEGFRFDDGWSAVSEDAGAGLSNGRLKG
jgi:hypothetical protein